LAAAILTRFGPFWSITATVPMMTVVIVAAVIVVSVVGSLVTAVSWAMSAGVLVEAYFSLFSIGVLIGGRNHLTNPLRQLAMELRVQITVMESLDEGSDDLCFRDVGNRIPHLGKESDVATKELGWLLVDAIQIMFGARSSTCSHVVVSEDLLKLFLGSDGVWGKACEPVHHSWREHDRKIVHHDAVSPLAARTAVA